MAAAALMVGASSGRRRGAPATREAALEFVALLRQMERRPDLERRLLHALEQLLQRDDPALCLELARHYAGGKVRSKSAAVRWVRDLHRVLLAARRGG